MGDDEEQYHTTSHKALLLAVKSLGKTQHIQKTTRSEPKPQQDEFHLVKGVKLDPFDNEGDDTDAEYEEFKQSVGIADLVDVLSGSKKHLDIGNQLKNVKQTKKVLERPLEKPAADRIKRSVGYENVKERLTRWDAVVAQNRSAETQVFPLKSETIYIDTFAHSKPLQTSLKSQLAIELDAAEAKLKSLKKARSGISEEDEQAMARLEEELMHKKMTLDELRAKRKELAYMKLRESQKSAKARMQNKIKSKKYHKLMKRQKIKEQLQQFELLQKTDPEAALAKLNELEKSRVLERASLRHKNTGSWAKNLQVRAKYDKDVRKDLAEQLQISRQLTDKKTAEVEEEDTVSDDEQVDHDVVMDVEDPFNPWMRAGKRGREHPDDAPAEMTNWRQYWLIRNRQDKLMADYKNDTNKENQKARVGMDNGRTQPTGERNGVEQLAVNAGQKRTHSEGAQSERSAKQRKTSKKAPVYENGWLVEELPQPIAKSIDDIFDKREDEVRQHLSRNLKKLAKDAKRLEKQSAAKASKQLAKKQKDELKNLNDLMFKQKAARPHIDEALNGSDSGDDDDDDTKTLGDVTKMALTKHDGDGKAIRVGYAYGDNIDPENLPEIKLKQHLLPPMSELEGCVLIDSVDDDSGDESTDGPNGRTAQQMAVGEAFEDDDIVADFTRDKSKDSELKHTEVNLSMPGWGSWDGAGMTEQQVARNRERNKRMVLKLAPAEKRRDDSKGTVYINEGASKHLRSHLVSDLPFPFTTLEDYEASIRAPMGRAFVPETAFRMLTRPAVITAKGKIIEPMDESELIKPERVLRHAVDRRIRKQGKRNAR